MSVSVAHTGIVRGMGARVKPLARPTEAFDSTPPAAAHDEVFSSCTVQCPHPEPRAPRASRRTQCGRAIGTALQLNADVPELGIELERMEAALAADTGLLGAAERRAEVP